MKPILYIRADGGPQTGLGHLVRCIALAHMLKNDFDIIFYCKEVPEKVKAELIGNQFQIREIAAETDFIKVIRQTDIVVLDGYGFNAEYQQKIKHTGAKLACIDDLHDKEFYADLVINHAPGVRPEDYRAQEYTQFALGPEFALLRPSFLEQAQKVRRIEAIKRVFICFGGSDSRNLTANVLQLVVDFSAFEKINVVTGAAYLYGSTLKSFVHEDSRVRHYHAVDEDLMLSIMLESDLAIVPASGVLLEALSCGCIIISGKYVDNQAIFFERYKNAGMFISSDDFENEKIYNSIEQALGHHQPASVLDGKSSMRLKDCFLRL